jgi:hypothetical protein
VFIGCSTIEDKSIMTKFGKISERYKELVLLSEFEAASMSVDNGDFTENLNLDALKNVKVTEYALKSYDISNDRLEIKQSVEMEYYRLNVYKVRTILDKQIWKYNEEKETWILQTGLPRFE